MITPSGSVQKVRSRDVHDWIHIFDSVEAVNYDSPEYGDVEKDSRKLNELVVDRGGEKY